MSETNSPEESIEQTFRTWAQEPGCPRKAATPSTKFFRAGVVSVMAASARPTAPPTPMANRPVCGRIEAGRVDGAGEVRIFFTVALRVMSPALVTVFLFQFVGIWNNYLLPVLMLADDRLQPVTVGLAGWREQLNNGTPYNVTVTGAFLSVLPLVVAFLCLQRFWRSGPTAGSVT